MIPVIEPSAIPQEFKNEFPEYPELILSLLYHRNIRTQEEIDHFFDPEYHTLNDPFLFVDMEKACARIYAAIQHKELIAIHGDYDADGICAAAILSTVVSKLGGTTTIYLPHREKEGYGLNAKTVDYLHEKHAKVIITCDCGISNRNEIAYASTKGIDTIVTDHHQIPGVLPDAFAILHPKLKREKYPDKNLAGGGVAFKFSQALLRYSKSPMSELQKESIEKWLLDLVAISSVADMVPLRGENRVLVRYGILVMKKNHRLGLAKLIAQAKINPDKITAETISFQIAPRINAAGRMDHASGSYVLLVESDPIEADRLVSALEKNNIDRQKATEKMYREAKHDLQGMVGKVLFIYREDWPLGLTGLVAGMLMRDLNLPVFVLGFDGEKVVGSGRAPKFVNIIDGITTVRDQLISFGGHPQACGFRFSLENKDTIISRLTEYFSQVISDEDTVQRIEVDKVISLSDITWEVMDYLNQFEPFGQENLEPVFYIPNVLLSAQRQVGKKSNHLKCTVSQRGSSLPAIGFNLPIRADMNKEVHIVCSPRINQWNGNREIQVVIHNILEN